MSTTLWPASQIVTKLLQTIKKIVTISYLIYNKIYGIVYTERGKEGTPMKYTVKINNLPADLKPFIVARAVEGDLWFWASYDDEELAHASAVEMDGIVVYAEEM